MAEFSWPTPPDDPGQLARVSVDPAGLLRFWQTHYAERYIPAGGSKFKWIVGRPGSGKTHALRMLAAMATQAGLLAVSLDAETSSIRGIQELMRSVLAGLDPDRITVPLAHRVMQAMGYEAAEAPAPRSFVTWLVEARGRIRDAAVRDVREGVDRVVGALDIDLGLKAAMSLAVADQLGAAHIDAPTLYAWLRGESLKRTVMMNLGIAQALNKQNARSILQGWGVLAQAAGHAGLLIAIDNVQQLLAPRDPDRAVVHYTRLGRTEAFEMFRELIDGADALPGIWFVLASRPELFDDARLGVKSYPALAARVSTEVEATEVNRFLDWVNWDELYRSDRPALATLVQRWADALGVLAPEPVVETGVESPVRRSVAAVLRQAQQKGEADDATDQG